MKHCIVKVIGPIVASLDPEFLDDENVGPELWEKNFAGPAAHNRSAECYADRLREIFLHIVLNGSVDGLEINSSDENESYHSITTIYDNDTNCGYLFGRIEWTTKFE